MARPVILETDWYTDCDDVMAARVLCNLHKRGIFQILACMINARFDESVRSLDAFLLDDGIDVPVGIVQEWVHEKKAEPTYQTRRARMRSKYADNNAAENPLKLYRHLLAASPEKVDIISIGFAENLAELLESQPDEFSPLSGAELISQKVSRLWMMAGRFDVPEGKEYNLRGSTGTSKVITESGSKVCANWPTPITFLGWEIGNAVVSGTHLPENDILRMAMVDHGSAKGRYSWDPMTVLLAAANSPAAAGYTSVRGYVSSAPDTGVNTFRQDDNGPHEYVVFAHEPEFYVKQVDAWLAKDGPDESLLCGLPNTISIPK